VHQADAGERDWGGVSAPAGTPPDAVEKLNAALQSATREQTSIDYFTKAGLGLRGSTAAAFGTMVNRNVDTFAKIIRDAKLDLE
jgi:tripartite-type tricarboxylate transporter receptor subunit TctC